MIRTPTVSALALLLALLPACGATPASTSTTAAPAAGTATGDGTVGSTMTFDAERLDDSGAFALADWRGKVVIVDFWASWCGPCRDALPFYDTLYAEHREAGLDVVAVSVDEARALAERFLDSVPVSYTVVWDRSHQLASRYALKTMPTTFVLDRTGTVRAVHDGFHDASRVELTALVVALLVEGQAGQEGQSDRE